jgi:hypothetical protein
MTGSTSRPIARLNSRRELVTGEIWDVLPIVTERAVEMQRGDRLVERDQLDRKARRHLVHHGAWVEVHVFGVAAPQPRRDAGRDKSIGGDRRAGAARAQTPVCAGQTRPAKAIATRANN